MFAQLFGDGGDGGQTQVKRRRAARTSAPRVRDIDTIDADNAARGAVDGWSGALGL